MGVSTNRFQAALRDFREARQRAALQQVLDRLTGRSNQLLSFDDVVEKLRLTSRVERGVQAIPVSAIVGSVDRYADFTRTFLPRHEDDKQRWARVQVAFLDHNTDLPAIEVYKVGEVYFVSDGNHRVSIARQAGMECIDARVIEVQTNIPLTPDVKPEDLIAKAEYAEFLDATGLVNLRPNVDLQLTVPGEYGRLKQEIEACLCCLGDRECSTSYRQAVECWYDEVYTPVAEAICERGILRWFPNRTITDFYVWSSEHREALEKELGWTIRPQAAVTDLAAKENPRIVAQQAAPGSWRKAKLLDRYTEQLFTDILVPISGSTESWQALDQAILIAKHEGAELRGLHLVASEAQKESAEVLALQAQFKQRCDEAQVQGTLAVETGDLTRKICDRGLLTDLVVLHVTHPPATGISSRGSALRAIISRSVRPVLAVPWKATNLERALLAFDGSPKAKEALFVAAYLAERWKTELTVLALRDGPRSTPAELDYARDYLELHEIEAEFAVMQGSMDVLPKIVYERRSDLVLMGSYSTSALEELTSGSTVNAALRQLPCPIFICR